MQPFPPDVYTGSVKAFTEQAVPAGGVIEEEFGAPTLWMSYRMNKKIWAAKINIHSFKINVK